MLVITEGAEDAPTIGDVSVQASSFNSHRFSYKSRLYPKQNY